MAECAKGSFAKNENGKTKRNEKRGGDEWLTNTILARSLQKSKCTKNPTTALCQQQYQMENSPH